MKWTKGTLIFVLLSICLWLIQHVAKACLEYNYEMQVPLAHPCVSVLLQSVGGPKSCLNCKFVVQKGF
jgi:hypothetical protein